MLRSSLESARARSFCAGYMCLDAGRQSCAIAWGSDVGARIRWDHVRMSTVGADDVTSLSHRPPSVTAAQDASDIRPQRYAFP